MSCFYLSSASLCLVARSGFAWTGVSSLQCIWDLQHFRKLENVHCCLLHKAFLVCKSCSVSRIEEVLKERARVVLVHDFLKHTAGVIYVLFTQNPFKADWEHNRITNQICPKARISETVSSEKQVSTSLCFWVYRLLHTGTLSSEKRKLTLLGRILSIFCDIYPGRYQIRFFLLTYRESWFLYSRTVNSKTSRCLQTFFMIFISV